MGKRLSRREFLQAAAGAPWAGAVTLCARSGALPPVRGPFRGTLCLFSKPVPQLPWQELAHSAKRAGFAGIDLTVRRGGHVMPQRAAEDLPSAVAAIRGEGLEVPMITTELVSSRDSTAVPILTTAAKLSIPFLKPGYYHYKFVDVRRELAQACNQFRGLVELAQKCGVQMGFHNHAGYIGAQTWDIAPVMDTLDPKWAGYYYDLENAAAEGGAEGWRIAANLVMPRMKMMAVKDFYWRKPERKGWEETTCPLGEGMCNSRGRAWKIYWQGLADEMGVPITVCHYPPGTSKWNRVEHRLFSFISLTWKGQPLWSYESVIHLIGATRTRSGLKVQAVLDTNEYETGVTLSDEEMQQLSIRRHKTHPEWNYTISPRVH